MMKRVILLLTCTLLMSLTFTTSGPLEVVELDADDKKNFDPDVVKERVDKMVSPVAAGDCKHDEKPPKPATKISKINRSLLFSNFKKLAGDPIALEQALCFFNKYKGSVIKNQDYIVIQDYTKPSNQKRFYLVNLKTSKIQVMASNHAMGGNNGAPWNYENAIPTNFSNKSGSYLGSSGFYISQERAPSSENWGWKMYLKGLQDGINNNARSRAIIFHPGYMKSQKKLAVFKGIASSDDKNPDLKMDRFQRSNWGCISVYPGYAEYVYNKMKGAGLFYNYTLNEKDYGKSYCPTADAL